MSRIAIIDRSKCIKERCGYICISVCPEVRMGSECIVKDVENFPVIDENLCTGCGICPKRCPVNAITIINLPQELEKPLHSYGVNSFRVYGKLIFNLQQNKTIAIIGKNGIGKTTLFNIMAGILYPNFGNLSETKIDTSVIISKMPISMQNYFISLYNKKIKLAYKPQSIELMRKLYANKKVKQIISEIKTNLSSSDSDITVFDNDWFSQILDRKVSELSGGELQKLAIFVCFSKNADIYFFDEPCTYLDIAERLKLALLLKKYSEKSNIFLIEHDLAILDYACEQCIILYGEEQAYGILSSLKNINSGINEYLAGFLKAENMRFRSIEFSFKSYSQKEINTPKLIDIPALVKKYEGFLFESEPISIRKNETIGIIGKNALGKTLFLKLITGIEKPDNTNIKNSLKFVYKPQYVEAFDMSVSEYLSQIDNKDTLKMIKPLFRLDQVFDSNMKSLSGGELQKVSIAKVLCTDADIYVLDEPSAYLDIESRLGFSTVISRMRQSRESTFLIVEHDIGMIELLANRIIPFTGVSSVSGKAHSVMEKYQGIGLFLSDIGLTIRKDINSGRPKINKPGSVLDREQRETGMFYK